MKTKDLTIVLILRTGGRYTVADVKLLAYHLYKNQSASIENMKVVCITNILIKEIRLHDVQFIPMQQRYEGWWAKLELFNPAYDLGEFLYLDLDTVILGDFSKLIPMFKKGFYMLGDFYKPVLGASGIMWIPDDIELKNKIWNHFYMLSESVIKRYRGDGEFIRDFLAFDMIQKYADIITSMKPFPSMKPLEKKPAENSVVCFHGKPSIYEAAKTIDWVRDYVLEERNQNGNK